MGFFGRSDVTKEAVEVIRSLKAEEVMTGEAEGKLGELLKQIENGKKFLQHSFKKIDNFRRWYRTDIKDTSPNNFKKRLHILIGSIKSIDSELNEDMQKVQRLGKMSERVINLIKDIESKEAKKSKFSKVKNIIQKEIKLEENEIKVMKIKIHSLIDVLTFLSGIKSLITQIVIDLRNALSHYLYVCHPNSLEDVILEHSMEMEGYLKLALPNLIRAEKLLKNSKIFIHKFKEYLRHFEKNSKKALRYELWIQNKLDNTKQ